VTTTTGGTTGGQGATRTVVTARKRTSPTASRRASAPARPWLAALRVTAKLAALVIFPILIAAGLLYVRLLHGPISVGFLAQPIERAIAEEISTVGVAIEDVALRLGDHGQIEFELKNVRITDTDNVALAMAPSALISLSRKALLSGRIAPESIDLVSPRLTLLYGEDGTLALKFATPAEPAGSERAKVAVRRGTAGAPVAPSAGPVDAEGGLGRIDLVKILSESSARARRRERASAYLREIGLKSATVIIDHGGRKSIWRVLELGVDLDHRRSRSSIAGRAKIESLAGPWTLDFRTYEIEATNKLQLAVSVQGLVPRGLARSLPQLAGLESLDVPVWAEAKLDLSNTGEILSGTIDIDAAPGRVSLPWLAATPLRIDGGHLALAYDKAARRLTIAPSVLVWGDSRVQFTGTVAHTAEGAEGARWAFDLRSAGGWIGAEPPHIPQLTIDDWTARGFVAPERGRAVLSEFRLKAGGAEVSAEGDVADMAGAMQARLDGRIGPMPASIFKAIWPAPLAPRSRDWVVKHLVRGWLQGGSFRLATNAGGGAGSGWAATTAPSQGSLTLEAANLAFGLVDSWPTLEAPRALVRLDDQSFEMRLPDATVTAADGRQLALKGTFSVDMTEPLPRTGRVAVRGQGPLSVAFDILDRPPFSLVQKSGLSVAGVDGKVDTQLTVSFPLGQALEPRDIVLEGKTRITEARLGQALGPYQVHGANITIDMTPTAAEAKADMLINGVVARAIWQHVFAAPPEKQPPLKITATLDNSYRTQLGLDINDLVQGDVGIEATISTDARNERRIHVRADLVNAEVGLDSVSWRKPRGKRSVFEFDVGKGTGAYPIELLNVKLVGDDVAIEGWMGIGSDNKVKEFRFPNFSLNVISSLETHGKVRPDGVWDVTAKGPTYDGRELFRSFFDVAHQVDPNAKIRPGLDLKAEITTVVGFTDTTLRNVKMTLQKRSNKLTGLDVRGTLDGGKAFAAVVRQEPGRPRTLIAESQDAGQVFKLVGFYPNAVGGMMNLEVNLEGEGAAERTGTLWARNFRVLGDPVVIEVLQSADSNRSERRNVVRQQFDFEIMRVPFSVGHGQFVMHNAVINGPFEGASLRGKVDFRAHVIDVGGTYVGGTGIMQVIASIPVLGPILTGPRGEGVFGITFAIKGTMANPQVVVNPLALLTPGIFREIFQMTDEDPRVVPRERPTPKRDGARASSAPASGPPSGALLAPGVQPEVGGSWSAETPPQQQPKRK
jgi:hypothetical protein